MRLRILALLVIALLGVGCNPPRCPPAHVTPPATEGRVGWLEAARPLVDLRIGDGTHLALLDTGFPRSSLTLNNTFLGSATMEMGGASIGPMHWGTVFGLESQFELLVGGDALSHAPLVFDARAAETRVERDFTPASGAAPLRLWSSGLCQAGREENGPEGPDLLLVEADLDGQPLTLAVDTGADLTFVRQGLIPDLATRPTLTGLPAHTAFAGDFTATVTRARALSVGGEASLASPVFTAPELDVGLDYFLQQFRDPPPRLDGALGLSFLREFEVSLALGDDAVTHRAIGLTRFDTQAHWTRDFVGIGIATTPNDAPPGLRIGALLSTSPARDAGLEAGDVITTVNGVPAQQAPQPWGQPGEVVHLGVARGANTLTVNVPIADLLPDP